VDVVEAKRGTWREAWRLAKPYWSSEDKVSAWGLLAVIVVLNFLAVAIIVLLTNWRKAIFDALQQNNEPEFLYQLGVFAVLSMFQIAFLVYQTYLGQMLQIRWRRWLTRRYLNAWLDERTYYRLQIIDPGTDNPDQRIAEDLDRFTKYSINLSIGTTGFLNAGITVVSFLAILWVISGPLTVPLGPWGQITVPGYMVWVGLIYAVGGTWLTFKIGRPLVRLNFDQQRYEADFRFSLVRLRENTESVALYGGEGRELGTFTDRFTNVVGNFWAIMKRVKLLGWYTRSYDQVAVIFPMIVAAPMYFSKRMTIGGLMQTAGAFFELQVSLSYLIKNYIDIAEWQSVVQRLSGFDRRVNAIAAAARAPQQIEVSTRGTGVEVSELELDLPDGTPLLRNVGFSVPAGEALLIAGPTGTGKSTLLRAISGIWPYGRGRIRLPEGTCLFLPQRPYLPLGTLRHAVLYPREDLAVPTARIAAVLRDVGIPELIDELDSAQNWAHRLSLGEQQRLAFARVLLIQPSIVFMDEASSALDEACEAQLYRLLRAAPWQPTVVSIGHRSTLRAFHDTVFDLGAMSKRRANLTVVT
jgi:vitamin B12/bleomycin/antimicrobial peptide transport system ATP-binding/permease protein